MQRVLLFFLGGGGYCARSTPPSVLGDGPHAWLSGCGRKSHLLAAF